MKETLDEQSRKALVSYRLERADETYLKFAIVEIMTILFIVTRR